MPGSDCMWCLVMPGMRMTLVEVVVMLMAVVVGGNGGFGVWRCLGVIISLSLSLNNLLELFKHFPITFS